MLDLRLALVVAQPLGEVPGGAALSVGPWRRLLEVDERLDLLAQLLAGFGHERGRIDGRGGRKLSMPGVGFEPIALRAMDFESIAYAEIPPPGQVATQS